MTEETSLPEGAKRELLSCEVADQRYAIDILSVREICGWSQPTALPNSAPHIRGVINRRGTVLPVIDLAIRLGIAAETRDARSVIILVETAAGDVGLLADAVSDILSLPVDAVQPVPTPAGAPPVPPIGGIANDKGRIVQLLDVEALVAAPKECAA